MRNLYDNQIIDYNDGNTEFVKEFNEQIHEYGAIVYNHEYNTYQYITSFEQIDFKKEVLPYYFKVMTSKLPNGMDLTMNYEFQPEQEEDEEILATWKEISQIELPTYDYEEDGEVYSNGFVKMNTKPSKHTVWILKSSGKDFLFEQDMLLIQPIIKYLTIVQAVIRNHTTAPFDTKKSLH
ncbi:MAG: hypothetical protein PUF50_04135 [Erysipelotrichaceae bacterium]|nr:hypothetical protein [Erysipelotrichaceae bacterium]